MLDGLALGETTPGPLIMVLAFVGFMAGYTQLGSLWAATAGLLVTVYYTFLPSFFFIFAGAPFIEKTHSNLFLKKVLQPVTAAVAGVILNLALFLGTAVVFPHGLSIHYVSYTALVWIVVSLIALFRFNVNMIVWIGISAVFGLLCYLAGFSI
jgi:chromate transporter